MSILSGIAQLLDSVVAAVTYDPAGSTGNVFIDRMPTDPGTAVGLFGSGGFGADSKLGYDEPTFQVRVRGDQDPRTSRNLLADIYGELHGLGPVVLPNGVHLLSCLGIQSDPVSIGVDGQGRHEHTLNFACETRSVTVHRI